MSQESYLQQAHERYNELMAQAMRKRMDRRLFMKASALGAAGGAAAVNGLLAACGGGEEEAKITTISAAGAYQYSRYPMVEKYNWRKLPWGGAPYIDGVGVDGQVAAPASWDFLFSAMSSYGGRFMNVLMHMRYGAGANMERVNLEPDLADKVSHAPDYSYYDYHIRQNKYFHDIAPVNGRKVTAEDVKYSFEQYKTKSIHSTPLAAIRKIEVLPDGETVRFTCEKPILWMNELVATSNYFIFAREHREGDQQYWKNQPIGSGPYKVVKYEYRVGTTAPRHEKYNQTDDRWKGYALPFLKEWRGTYVGDYAAAKSAYRTGQIDYVWISTYTDLNDILITTPESVVSIIPHDPAVHTAWVYNLTNKKFQDVRVRRAFSMALDRKAIVDTVMGGMATEGAYPMAYDFLNLDEPIPLEEQGPWHQYNPTKAKELLAEAGYPNGMEVEFLTTSPVADAYLVVAKFLEDVGVRVKFVTQESQVVTTAGINKAFPDMMVKPTIPGYSGAIVALNLFLPGSPQNRQQVDDPKLTDMVLKAAYSLDPDEQVKLFWQINDYTLDQQLAYLNIYNAHRVFIRQPWLHNVQDHIHSWTCCWGSWQWGIAWIDDTAPAERRGRLKA